MDRRWIAGPAGVGSASWNTVVTSRSAGVHARGPVGDDGVAGSVRFTAPGGEVDIEATVECGVAFEGWIEVDGVERVGSRGRAVVSPFLGLWFVERVDLPAGEHTVAVVVTGREWARCSIEVRHG